MALGGPVFPSAAFRVIPFDALNWRAVRVWYVVQSLILGHADTNSRVGGIPVREIGSQLREWRT
jgi:hypothetical protein